MCNQNYHSAGQLLCVRLNCKTPAGISYQHCLKPELNIAAVSQFWRWNFCRTPIIPPRADLYASALQLCARAATCAARNVYTSAKMSPLPLSSNAPYKTIIALGSLKRSRHQLNTPSACWSSSTDSGGRNLALWCENLCKILLLWPNFKFCASTTISGYFCWWERGGQTDSKQTRTHYSLMPPSPRITQPPTHAANVRATSCATKHDEKMSRWGKKE